jgi:hypothetical protein
MCVAESLAVSLCGMWVDGAGLRHKVSDFTQ